MKIDYLPKLCTDLLKYLKPLLLLFMIIEQAISNFYGNTKKLEKSSFRFFKCQCVILNIHSMTIL